MSGRLFFHEHMKQEDEMKIQKLLAAALTLAAANANAAKQCLPCPAGKWAGAGNTSSTCSQNCSTGYYCPGTGSKIACPVGTYNDVAGKSVVTECKACPAGKYCPEGTSAPKTCGADRYCPAGSGSETSCPANTTTAGATGVSSPNRCYANIKVVYENGIDGKSFVEKALPADGRTVNCNNATFGDPDPGASKNCYTRMSSSNYTVCTLAYENRSFTLPVCNSYPCNLNGNPYWVVINGAANPCSYIMPISISGNVAIGGVISGVVKN
jgi:hypothetical protein